MNFNDTPHPLSAERMEELVKEVQAGRTEPYRALVLHFQRRLYLYCYHMLGSRTESEDAVQEILLRVYRQITRYRPTVSFSAWLYKIAYRHCLNVLRQRKGQQRLLSLMQLQWPTAPPPPTPDTALRMLAGLSTEERQLVILRVLEERSFAEIAEIMGRNEAALRKKLERIRKKLNQPSTRKASSDDRQSVFPGL